MGIVNRTSVRRPRGLENRSHKYPDFWCCSLTPISFLLRPSSGYCDRDRALIAAISLIDFHFAISRSRNVLDRLSPLSVLTVEFPVHRQVRSASILASVVSI
jgi:hypothetical protein